MDTGSEVIWRAEAKEDVRNILHYLSRSSFKYAEEWSDLIDQKISLLQSFPEIGKMVPDRNLSFFREIPVGRYRLLYIYLNNVITIVAVRHSASNLGKLP